MKEIMLTPRVTIAVALMFVANAMLGQAKVQWVTWEEAIELGKTEPRKVVVDVYTDWCGWCKKMDKATFQNEMIAEYLNEHYYAIKFNAEQRDDIKIKEKVYKYVRNGSKGYHELAAEITFGKLSFPTIVFLDEKMNVIQPIAGFKDPEMFEMIMTYFGEDHHKTTPWKKYTVTFTSHHKP